MGSRACFIVPTGDSKGMAQVTILSALQTPSSIERDCRSFALHFGGQLSAHVKGSLSTIGALTQLTTLDCGYCDALEGYTSPVLSLPSLVHLHVRVSDIVGRYPTAEALRGHYAIFSSKLTSLGFTNGTQIMVRHPLILSCIVGCQSHQRQTTNVEPQCFRSPWLSTVTSLH